MSVRLRKQLARLARRANGEISPALGVWKVATVTGSVATMLVGESDRVSTTARGSREAEAAIERAAKVFGLDKVATRALAELLERTLVGGGARMRVGDLSDVLGGVAATLAAFEPASPLVCWRLVNVGDGAWSERALSLHPSFWPRLIGHWPRELPRAVRVPEEAIDTLVLAEPLRREARQLSVWLRTGRDWRTLYVRGARGSGRGTVACAIAGALGLPALVVRGDELGKLGADVIAREAIWQQAAVVIDGGEDADPSALAAIAEVPAPLIVTRLESGTIKIGRRATRHLDVPAMDAAMRREVWARALRGSGIDASGIDLDRVGERYRFGAAQIHEVVEHAMNADRIVTSEALLDMARTASRIEVGGLARRLDAGKTWDDLVISTRTRRDLELVITSGRHGHLLEGNGIGRGVACLFWGAPGTGKTLASQVVARGLDRELYRVDLSQVVDKYVGETEKRLDRLFREAEAADAVLLFDEADALFATRTDVRDAHDRYANLETSFILQRLEEHRGVCILASNARSRIDAAFQRRLLFVIEFPQPSPRERVGIWRRLLPADALSDTELGFLADRFELSGGDIRNAVLVAQLLARRAGEPMAMRHAVIAGWRELGKAGRLVDVRDFEPWAKTIIEFTSERS